MFTLTLAFLGHKSLQHGQVIPMSSKVHRAKHFQRAPRRGDDPFGHPLEGLVFITNPDPFHFNLVLEDVLHVYNAPLILPLIPTKRSSEISPPTSCLPSPAV